MLPLAAQPQARGVHLMAASCLRPSCLPAAFKDVKVLTVSEVGVLFDEYTGRTQQRDADYQPNAMLVKAVEYTQRFSTNKNKETLIKIRE